MLIMRGEGGEKRDGYSLGWERCIPYPRKRKSAFFLKGGNHPVRGGEKNRTNVFYKRGGERDTDLAFGEKKRKKKK